MRRPIFLSALAAWAAGISAAPTGHSFNVRASNETSHSGLAAAVDDTAYWLKDITHQGQATFNSNPSGYVVFRNVKDYGAKGDGVTDDTAAINSAISSGGRCGPYADCQSSTITPAVVYFPAGTYIISTSIIDYYNTQIIGNANNLPIIKATAGFQDNRMGLIDGNRYQDSGAAGWTSTNVFLRQIRNLILDMTAIPATTAATGIHWPTSQATSIQNVEIRMTQSSASQQQGLFIENGSGGFLSDLTISGGLYGMNVGNQQFAMRNIKISNAVTGISQIWNWGWTWQGLNIANCGTALSINAGGSSAQEVGSLNVLDSTISNCPVFIDSAWTTSSSPASAGSVIIENVALTNVPTAVKGPSSTYLAGTTGSMTIAGWGQGHKYVPNGPATFQGSFTPATRASGLLASGTTNYYTKSKPQYEASPVASFVSVKSSGARGDGNTDDTAAIQAVLNSAASSGKIVFFDHGVYKVTNTLYVPPGSRLVGEAYSVIAASGGPWTDKTNPVPVVQIGRSGESGSFEWSDMIVATLGPAPGAVLIEWNLKATQGSGMWDVHTRIGGWAGSQLQVAQCPKGSAVSAQCMAAYMSMHITSSASNVYMENSWLWTADHDLDSAASTQINIYTGRGLLIEGNTIWLYGTGVEHHSLYQYQFTNAHDVVTSYIQTETPYYQPIPDARNSPYPLNTAWNDPTYANCLAGNCNALGLRILNSHNLVFYGAGLYSFFNNYETSCSDSGNAENCQSEIFSIEGSSTANIWVYTLNTIGAQNMIVKDGTSLAWYADNLNVYPTTIAYFTYNLS